ncbi:hypothetical protein EDB80DRAFT_674386 [Ilyonectria destructans]|nr:hypothetical protein EDB80DRAFT_674386 [Ilyonectria destructans]
MAHAGARWRGKIGGFFPPCCAMNAPPLPRRQMRRTAGLILITPPAQAGSWTDYGAFGISFPHGEGLPTDHDIDIAMGHVEIRDTRRSKMVEIARLNRRVPAA